MTPIKRLALSALMSLAFVSHLTWAASHEELDKLKTGCDAGDQRSCMKLESIALHDKKLETRVQAVNRIANRDSLGRIANAIKADSETRQAANHRLAEFELSAFNAARDSGTEVAYAEFRKAYPQSKRVGELEELAWQAAQRAGTKEAYLSFQKAFPDNRHGEDITWALHEDTPFAYDVYLGRVTRGELQGKYKDEASRRLHDLLPGSPLSQSELQDLTTRVQSAVSPHSISDVYALCASAVRKVDEPDQPIILMSSVYSGSTREQVSASKDHVLDGITIEKDGAAIRLLNPVPSLLAPQSPVPFRHVLIFAGGALSAAYLNVEGRWYKWR